MIRHLPVPATFAHPCPVNCPAASARPPLSADFVDSAPFTAAGGHGVWTHAGSMRLSTTMAPALRKLRLRTLEH